MHDDVKRDFTHKARDILKSEYSVRGPFVSDALALIVHAAKQWQKWQVEPPAGMYPDLALKRELVSYGFKGIAELDAIFAFITWTEGDYTHPPKSA